MVDQNSLYVWAAAGRLTPAMVGYYLFNVRHLVRHTPVHLERARLRAHASGDHALAAHYQDKWAEEQGHDAWADQDLERLDTALGVTSRHELSPVLLGLLQFIEATIDADPAGYLAYILFTEYLVASMAPGWLTLIHERCGIPARMLTVIGKHAELDRAHSSEGLEAIDRLVPDPAKIEMMRRVLRDTLAAFDRFSADVVAHGEAATCTTSFAA